ncbi:immunoglobulin domain-containing protein [Acidovorax lacteus]|uniref:Ig-like domain-containing protein n=1 Tax=Acidovorax lacteus TaxID=1924988 RepID=A0ABP8LA85_9BURK
MKQIDSFSEYGRPIGRRALGLWALGVGLSACSGGGDNPASLPVVTLEPQDAVVTEGETARFTVTAQNETQLRYQWLRNGTVIEGATSSSLVVSNALRSDHGARFSVVLTNAVGAVHSRSAVLRVHAAGQVVASDWSESLTAYASPESTSPAEFGYIAIGTGAWVYAAAFEAGDYVLRRSRADGSVTETFRLPRVPNTYTQIAVWEDPATREILVARCLIASVALNINTYQAVGGGIYRLEPVSGQFIPLFESDRITPSGLARDTSGNLYTVDLKTGDVLKITAGSLQITTLYQVSGQQPLTAGGVPYDFVLRSKGLVAVTADGTVYATLVTSSPRVAAAYQLYGEQWVRVRNGKAEMISVRTPAQTNGITWGMGARGNSVFFLYKSAQSTLVRKVDAEGNVLTVAGTWGSQEKTQFGSPGVLGRTSKWIGIGSDGQLYLEGWDAAGPRFFGVLLPADPSPF